MVERLITTRFSAQSTAAEVVDGRDLTGLRAVVTGASSGLGGGGESSFSGCAAEDLFRAWLPASGGAGSMVVVE